VIFIESDVDSTNLFAKRLLLKGFDSDAVIISEKQSAGRGRADRTWYSPSGGLYMSLILQGRLKPSMFHLYSFVLALAASIVLEQMVMLQVDLKWPNDLLVSGKKIGGILSELITENLEIPVIILGIGINLNETVTKFPDDLQNTATSVLSETGEMVNRESVVSGIVNAFNNWFVRDPKLESVIDEYRLKCITIGKKVNAKLVRDTFAGHVIDVNNEGSLIVRDESGIERIISSGEVIHLEGDKE
jgi:BirA family biotin operon repressor/biotin-[acetyl-CoA-carboxylase] ligase